MGGDDLSMDRVTTGRETVIEVGPRNPAAR